MRLEGKTAIVTGGGRDIGLACAKRLARAGAQIAVNYFTATAGAARVVAEIEQNNGRAIAVQGDMTNPDDVGELVERAVQHFGGLDILIHNSGGMLARKTMPEMDLAHWKATMDLNLTSLYLLVKAVLPHMREGGAIVAMASEAGRDGGGPGGVAYATSKGAIMTMTRALAKELGPKIRVNALCPGTIDTEFHKNFTKPEVRTKIVAITPMRREGTPEDVASLATFLASDEAAFITGACIDVNGGTIFS